MMFNQIHHSRGIALITALLVMALASIAAVAVLVSGQTALRRSATLIDGEKAWWYATGMESFAVSVIDYDTQKSNSYDGLDEIWSQPQLFPVEQGTLTGSIIDLQSRFNLNNFDLPGPTVSPKALAQFQQLFASIPELSNVQAQPIAEAIKDWIDSDQIPTGSGGAEDTDYSGLRPPYLAANREMKSVTELLAVKGVTPEIYQALLPYVTVLPLDTSKTPTKINVNTAPVAVLMSLAPNMDRLKVEQWADEKSGDRIKTPVKDQTGLDMLYTNGTLQATVKTNDLVVFRSNYFAVSAAASIGTGRVALYSVLLRPANGKPIVIARSLDTE